MVKTIFSFCGQNRVVFSLNKDKNWITVIKASIAILKTNLLVGNDRVIDIFTSEDMENISPCVFSLSHCLQCIGSAASNFTRVFKVSQIDRIAKRRGPISIRNFENTSEIKP